LNNITRVKNLVGFAKIGSEHSTSHMN